jgi:hypothetical protein
MQDFQKIGMAYTGLLASNPFYRIWEDQMCQTIDLAVWTYLQTYFFPFYVISKQDEWSEWAKISLNGLKPINICKG